MNGRKAKKIRKLIYGEDGSYRFRNYREDPTTGVITAGHLRNMYQKLKRDFLRSKSSPDQIMPY